MRISPIQAADTSRKHRKSSLIMKYTFFIYIESQDNTKIIVCQFRQVYGMILIYQLRVRKNNQPIFPYTNCIIKRKSLSSNFYLSFLTTQFKKIRTTTIAYCT